MSYEVLARKYRPINFDEVIGQDHIIKALVNSIDQNKIHLKNSCALRTPCFWYEILEKHPSVTFGPAVRE